MINSAVLLLFLVTLSTTTFGAEQNLCESHQTPPKAADRTITWHPWQQWTGFRVRTGDRYLGDTCWEHYLAFGLYRPSTKEIKISMIYLATELMPDVEIAPGRRYAIVKVTNSNMTAHKGPLELDCTGDGIKKPLFASRTN